MTSTGAAFGLDHALVCVRDIAATRQVLMDLGFLNRGFSQHPWGTSTTIFMFENQLFEVVGIGDETLLDGYETGGFRFGRHIQTHLAQREGVCLSALNSTDATGDAVALAARGVAVTGGIDFGRDVTRADGTPDRTKTRLEVLCNPALPRLSLFLCQQFRRDLIEYPEWMRHPNGVHAIAAWTVVAPPQRFAETVDWLERVEGTDAVFHHGEARIPTARGTWRVLTPDAFAHVYGIGVDDLPDDDQPAIMGIDLDTPTPEFVADKATLLGVKVLWRDDILALPEAHRFGGVCLRFGPFSKIKG